MSLSEKSIKEFQAIFKKEYNKDLSFAEASEGANNLVGLFKLLYDIDCRDKQRKQRLKKEPKGFSFMDGKTYNCSICHKAIKDEEIWYDKNGIKCLKCQENYNKKL